MTEGIVTSKLTTDGRGLAFIDGKATFIKGALPDETVRIKYLKRKRQYDEAEVIEIITPSKDRVVPKCKVFGICGGCSLQHLDSTAQIHHKELWLRELLERTGLEAKEWLLPLQKNIWGYRHKARMGVRFVRKKGEVLVGFREAASNFLTNTERCEILHPGIGEHLQELKQMLTTLSIKDHIAQIEVAGSDAGVALVFRHMVPMPSDDLAKIIALAEKYSWFIYLQSGGVETIEQVHPLNKIDLSYRLPSYDLSFNFRPQDFTQVNMSLNEAMVQQALALLDVQSDDTVLDLFCGLGNFTLPLARHAKSVMGIEGDVHMTELAGQNAQANGISNASFAMVNLFEDDALKPLAMKVDKLLLDPPRAGAEAVVRAMKLWDPARIVYVSCHLSSLVRDIEILVKEQGYVLEKIGVMDMFPHTNHVESMALLTKKLV